MTNTWSSRTPRLRNWVSTGAGSAEAVWETGVASAGAAIANEQSKEKRAANSSPHIDKQRRRFLMPSL